MFHQIPPSITDRMRQLEAMDAQDRVDGTPRLRRLRQVPPETGRFLAILLTMAPEGELVEIGTSAGYSTLWLALACREVGRTITTIEILPQKAELARETFRVAGVEEVVKLVEGDALQCLTESKDLGFCFLDAEKDLYAECYELAIPRLVEGGLLVADNTLDHAEVLQPTIDRAMEDPRVDSVVVPIGKGLLVCRKGDSAQTAETA